MKKIFIFAGKRIEAAEYARAKGLKNRDWIYGHSANTLRGFARPCQYVRVGTWRQRKDRYEFFDQVQRIGLTEWKPMKEKTA